MNLNAVILAGGIGKRITPLGINKPKAMFKILGKPFIQHILESIRDSGMVENVIIMGAAG